MPGGRASARHAGQQLPLLCRRRSDGGPCRGHPLDQGKSDQTQAGFLARGSSLDTWPSQASHDLASGPVADLPTGRKVAMRLAHRLQLQGQLWIQHHIPY